MRSMNQWTFQLKIDMSLIIRVFIKEGLKKLKKCGFIHIWVGGWFKIGTKSTKKTCL